MDPARRISAGHGRSPIRGTLAGHAVSPARRTSPRLAGLARRGLLPRYSDPPRRRRRRVPEVPDLDWISLPDAMYYDKDNPAGHRVFVIKNIPEPVTYGLTNSTVHRLSFSPVVACPRVLHLNGTLSLPEYLPQYVPYTLTSVLGQEDEMYGRPLYEVRVGRRPYINIAPEIPIEKKTEFKEYNRIGLKMSRLITKYIFDAHATWRSLNHMRVQYMSVWLAEPATLTGMVLHFKSLEDEVVSLLTNTLSALTNFGACMRVIQEFNCFYRSYRRRRFGPRRHPRIMETMEFDFEIFKTSIRQAKDSIQVASVRSLTHDRIRQEILSTLQTTLVPFS